MNFDVWGCVVGLVALKALLPFCGITHAVYQLSTVCMLKKEHIGTWDGGSAEMVQNSSAVLYIVRFRMLFWNHIKVFLDLLRCYRCFLNKRTPIQTNKFFLARTAIKASFECSRLCTTDPCCLDETRIGVNFFRWPVEIPPIDRPGDAQRDGANFTVNFQWFFFGGQRIFLRPNYS